MTNHEPREHLEELMGWARDYQSSRVVTTAVEEGILERFADGPLTIDQATRQQDDPEAITRFLRALVALGLLERNDDEQLEPSALTQQFLLPGSEFDLRPIMALFHRNYDLWADLPQTLKRGHDVENNAFGDVEFGREFMLAMETRAHFAKKDVAERLAPELEPGDHVIDLGGGTGVFARELLERLPKLEVTVADLDHVLETAREFSEDSPVRERLNFRELDFFEDDTYGDNLDGALLFSILHMFDEAWIRTILEQTAEALKPGGLLVIRDYVLNEDGFGPLEANLFDLHMLLATDAGGNLSWTKFRNLLERSGFTNIRQEELPGDHDDLVLAQRKPT